jgi:dolichol-phosphate mannosyltransferase
MPTIPTISVVIAVYNAEDCLSELDRRLHLTLTSMQIPYEVIYVEDCGTDLSWQKIVECASSNKRVKGFKLSRNFGQHHAITAGLDQAHGLWVVAMDCDLQDPPEEIPRLFAEAKNGWDIVIFRRINREEPYIKKISAKLFYKVFSYFAGFPVDGQLKTYRIMSSKVVQAFCSMREQLRSLNPLMHWMGFNVKVISVSDTTRFAGKSSYTYKKLWKLALDVIVAYSDKPLRLSIQFGFICMTGAFLFGSYIFLKALLFGPSGVGWSSTIVSIYFIGGVIIANLGIIGIYLGKLFDESRRRPLYIIAKQTQYENDFY